jgi:hypothetical protein
VESRNATLIKVGSRKMFTGSGGEGAVDWGGKNWALLIKGAKFQVDKRNGF